MKFYIVRHGVTEWNALGKVQGSADVPLAREGVRLAELTGEALKEVPFDVCFTSPLIRAKKTAELILAGRVPEVPIIEDERIREIDFGVLEGSRFKDENGRVLNPLMELFFMKPEEFPRPEKGENIEDIILRTREFWEEKVSDPGLRNSVVLVASHGCAVRALLQNVHSDRRNFWRGHVPPNCSVTVAEVNEKGVTLLEEDRVYAAL